MLFALVYDGKMRCEVSRTDLLRCQEASPTKKAEKTGTSADRDSERQLHGMTPFIVVCDVYEVRASSPTPYQLLLATHDISNNKNDARE